MPDITTSPENSTSYSTNTADSTGIRGWVCPRCGRVNSPYIKHCDCSPPEKSNYGNVDYRYDIDWVKAPTVTVPDRMVYTGNACKNCPTNPANGGDGHCNCILGDYNKVTC